MIYKNYPILYRGTKDSFKGHFLFFKGINCVSEEVLASERILKNLKEEKSSKLTTFKALQYNITRSLDINSSNKMFSSIHNFLSKTLSLFSLLSSLFTLLSSLFSLLSLFSLSSLSQSMTRLIKMTLGELIQTYLNDPPQQEYEKKRKIQRVGF